MSDQVIETKKPEKDHRVAKLVGELAVCAGKCVIIGGTLGIIGIKAVVDYTSKKLKENKNKQNTKQ